MTNFQIADIFSLLAKLMEIHGENSFKTKSYSNTAFNLEKITTPVSEMELSQLASIKGVGDSAAKKITEILLSGRLKMLDELVEKTPTGVVEMMNIKGLGTKKINTIWKEMEVESIGELLYACNENRLTLYKGFGAKTQQNIKDTIEFYLRNQGSFLYAQTELAEKQIKEQLEKIIAPAKIYTAGAAAMHHDIINELEFVSDVQPEKLSAELTGNGIHFATPEPGIISFKPEAGINIKINCVPPTTLLQTVFEKNASPEFLDVFTKKYILADINKFETDEAYFSSLSLPYLPPYIRHHADVLSLAEANQLPELIQVSDIRGIIHCHSNWSDGGFSLEQMAAAAIKNGFEYMAISDHSKTAFYANGLSEERIKAQHQQIDELNAQLAPFKIFKSIESDILNDGNLDYSDNILSTFDLVIASVHSNLKMTEEKAMQRLIKAIENPYTTILGHMTGRLLLSRNGYPVNHEKIIDACIANNVVLELNAHPSRLDMDWKWIRYAVEKGALISIDPDAHALDGFNDIRYGVIAAQKGLLTPAHNLSSFPLQAFENFIGKK